MTYDQVAHEEEEEEEEKKNLEKLCIISLSSTPVMEDARKKIPVTFFSTQVVHFNLSYINTEDA